MRVLLIVPTFKYSSEYPAFLSLSDFPTGLAYLASSLKEAGHEVYGCNPNNIVGYVNAQTMMTTVLTKRIQEVNPELIGLGGLCTDYLFLRDAITTIRQVAPATPIVLGGQIVTNDAEEVFKLLKPDYAVKGEGERAIIDITQGLETGWSVATDDGSAGIKGSVLGLLTIKRIWESKPLPIDSIPFPDYEPFGIQDMMDNYSMATRLLYRYPRTNPRPFGIVTARGCPFKCSFCVDHHRGYRPRSMDSIVEEIKITYEKYHYNILLILDELFAADKERMREFCEAVITGQQEYDWDFDWMFQTHASAKFDLETLLLAKRAGCFFFSYGLESASPAVLKSMNKKIEPSQVVDAIKLAEEAGIGFGANLIFGDVAETQETWAESLSFWLEHCKSSFVFLSNLSPYPGSGIFTACQNILPDRKTYYENIDKSHYNLTQIPNKEYAGLMQITQNLEQGWLFVRTTPILKIEKMPEDSLLLTYQGGWNYKITAKCPYCKEEVEYVERIANAKEPFWLGTGCTKCNRRIKVGN